MTITGVTAVMLLWMVALSGYDIRRRRLPNWLTLPGAATVLGVAVVTGQAGPAVAGGTALCAVYATAHLIRPAGLGAGDVKLAAALGALTAMSGAHAWLLAAIGAPLLTTVAGLAALAVRPVPTLPHGPAMCLASIVAMSLGTH